MDSRISIIVMAAIVVLAALISVGVSVNHEDLDNDLTGNAVLKVPFAVHKHLTPSYKFVGFQFGRPEYEFTLIPDETLLKYAENNEVIINDVLWSFDGLTIKTKPKYTDCDLVVQSLDRCKQYADFSTSNDKQGLLKNHELIAKVSYTINGKYYDEPFYAYTSRYNLLTQNVPFSPVLLSSKTDFDDEEMKNNFNIESFFNGYDTGSINRYALHYSFRIRAKDGLHRWLQDNDYDLKIENIKWTIANSVVNSPCGRDIYTLAATQCQGKMILNPLLSGEQEVTAEVTYSINGGLPTKFKITKVIDLSKNEKPVKFVRY